MLFKEYIVILEFYPVKFYYLFQWVKDIDLLQWNLRASVEIGELGNYPADPVYLSVNYAKGLLIRVVLLHPLLPQQVDIVLHNCKRIVYLMRHISSKPAGGCEPFGHYQLILGFPKSFSHGIKGGGKCPYLVLSLNLNLVPQVPVCYLLRSDNQLLQRFSSKLNKDHND